MRFSERYGYKPVREIIQKESIDDDLKNRLWSCLYNHFFDMYQSSYTYKIYYEPQTKLLWQNFLKKPINTLPSSSFDATKQIRIIFNNSKWYEIYDLVEEIIKIYPNIYKLKSSFLLELNIILEEENSAYRIIDNQVTEITSEQEIQSIEEALENTSLYSGVQQHLKRALELMSDRQSPNYAKSMQESISGVEGLAMKLLNHESITLEKAIPQLKNKYKLHQTLLASLDKLYAYTCDEDGVRHGSPNESTVTYSEAKFMLVACTNFINYLIDKTKDQN